MVSNSDKAKPDISPAISDYMTNQEHIRSKFTGHRVESDFDLAAFPERPVPPGGDSWNSFRQRVREVLELLGKRFAGQTVVAVTHAGFIVMSTLELLDIPRPGTGTDLDPDLTGITEWQGSGGKWRLIRYNDCFHLRR